MKKKKKPIVLFIYKRPEHTLNVLKSIISYHPDKIYIIADGPKNRDEIEMCMITRETATNFSFSKKTEIKTNFSKNNMGGPYRIPSGLNWVFEQEEDAIILEDDCVPSQSFFPFCEELLCYYKNDKRIGHISGNNFQKEKLIKDSYYFSIFNHCWGWATWRRAWKYYDSGLTKWPTFKSNNYIKNFFPRKKHVYYWSNIFENLFFLTKVHWDYTWTFSCWSNNFLTIIPATNLVSNIGFGINASNTKNPYDSKANMTANDLTFPLIHPDCILRNYDADEYVQKTHFGPKPYYSRVLNGLHRFGKYFQNLR
jgi:hypothetical protein